MRVQNSHCFFSLLRKKEINIPPVRDVVEQQIRSLVDGENIRVSADLLSVLDELSLAYRVVEEQVQLRNPPELLDVDLISRRLSRAAAIEVFWSIDSTNSYLMAQKETGDVPRVCFAEQQLAGRGRRGRQWISPFGRNIYISLRRNFAGQISDLTGLSVVVGLSAVCCIRECGINAGLKWPNDILLDGGKLAGILVEVGTNSMGRVFAVIGIGVNLALDSRNAAQIDQRWSHLGLELSKSRNEFAAGLLEKILSDLETFDLHGFKPFQTLWPQYNVYQGMPVVVHRGDETISGSDAGIDDDGNLLLQIGEKIQVFSAGEVSLRPGKM